MVVSRFSNGVTLGWIPDYSWDLESEFHHTISISGIQKCVPRIKSPMAVAAGKSMVSLFGLFLFYLFLRFILNYVCMCWGIFIVSGVGQRSEQGN